MMVMKVEMGVLPHVCEWIRCVGVDVCVVMVEMVVSRARVCEWIRCVGVDSQCVGVLGVVTVRGRFSRVCVCEWISCVGVYSVWVWEWGWERTFLPCVSGIGVKLKVGV